MHPLARPLAGPFNPTFAAQWGIVDIDWSGWKNGPGGWSSAVPMNCDASLAHQAALIKAIDPSTRVFVYRNMVKALPVRGHTYRLADRQTMHACMHAYRSVLA